MVVVGHSQGSVLAATVVGRQYEAADGPVWAAELRLVTCGSPLDSLYASFFPTEFDAERFKKVRAGGEWTNCWRATDAIASDVPAAHKNAPLTDPGDGAGRHLGHGGYWTDDGLRAVVDKYRTLAPALSQTQTTPGARPGSGVAYAGPSPAPDRDLVGPDVARVDEG